MTIQGGLGAGGRKREPCPGGVLEVPSGLVGTIYTRSNSGFMENPCFEKLANFSGVMWTCGGLAPCGPSALLATEKASFGKEGP